MKSRFAFLLVVLLAVFSFACGNDTSLATKSAPGATPVPLLTESDAAISQPEMKAPTAEEIAAARAKQAEARDRVIEHLNDELAGKKTSWQATLRGSYATKLCEYEDQFDSLSYALSQLENASDINWEHLSVTKDATMALYRKLGEQYARELVKVIKTPYENRKTMGMCGSGEGAYVLTDSSRMMGNLSQALESAKMRPEDIGATAEGLRKLLHDDLTVRLADIKSKRGEEDPEYAGLLRDMAEWNLDSAQIVILEQ